MECSICFENITKETGKAELSCSHSFHLKCLSNWFNKNENCPCCRHEANDMEKMGFLQPVEEEYTDDDDDDINDNETEYDTDEDDAIGLNASRDRARHNFRLKMWDMTKGEFEAYAATRIAAVVRGHQSRMTFFEMKCLKQKEKDTMNDIEEFQKDLMSIKQAMVFYKKVASMTYRQRKAFAATKIQSVWRSKKQQENYKSLRGVSDVNLRVNLETQAGVERRNIEIYRQGTTFRPRSPYY